MRSPKKIYSKQMDQLMDKFIKMPELAKEVQRARNLAMFVLCRRLIIEGSPQRAADQYVLLVERNPDASDRDALLL